MSEFIYHIKIKKEYASSLIEDLQQVVDAIEIVEGSIPEWQQQETMKRLAEMKANPDSAIEKDKFFDLLHNDEE